MTNGTKLSGIPAKRYGAPKAAVVAMSVVPDPPVTERNGYADMLYKQISGLKLGSALKVEFEASSQADYVRAKLRTKAKADKQFLSSSRSEDGKTRYFWLEKL